MIKFRTEIKRGRARRNIVVRRSKKIYKKPVIKKVVINKPRKAVVKK
jgi:hypothetical protein